MFFIGLYKFKQYILWGDEQQQHKISHIWLVAEHFTVTFMHNGLQYFKDIIFVFENSLKEKLV